MFHIARRKSVRRLCEKDVRCLDSDDQDNYSFQKLENSFFLDFVIASIFQPQHAKMMMHHRDRLAQKRRNSSINLRRELPHSSPVA